MNEGYYPFFRNLPHLILVLIIGFLTMLLISPIFLLNYYPLPEKVEFFQIFIVFWDKMFMSLSRFNWIIALLLILAGSYTFGFIFMGFYDSLGIHIIRFSSRFFAWLFYPVAKKHGVFLCIV